MNSRTLVSRVALYLAVLPALLVVTLIRMRTPLFVGDDAYMTFRVSLNLLRGNGFVYNIGEYLPVTTTPLWASLVAGFSAVFNSEPIEIFRPIEYLLTLLNCILIFVLSSAGGRYVLRGALSALLFALSWHMNYSAIIGMEPPLLVALMLGSILLQEHESYRWLSAVLAATAFMTRPEGALLLIIIGAYRLWKERRLPWPEIIPGAALVLGYLFWLYWYFGSILPHAGIAKSIAYYRDDFQAFRGLQDHIMMFTLTPWFDAPNLIARILPFAVWAVWLTGAAAAAKQSPAQLLLAVFTAAVLLLYTVMNPLLFEWYVAPLEASYAVSLVWGAAWLLSRMADRLWPQAVPQLSGFAAAAILVFGFLRYDSLAIVLRDTPGGYHWPSLVGSDRGSAPNLLPVLSPEQREKLYAELARQLEPQVTHETVVMAPEFGAFGYYSSASIISSIGHNNLEMLEYLPAPRDQVASHMNNGITQAMIDRFKPDYVLSLESFIRMGILRSDKFHREYELLEKLPSSVFGSRGLYLFKRRNGSSSDIGGLESVKPGPPEPPSDPASSSHF